jgi:glucose/mannose transport system substrate-binding protein
MACLSALACTTSSDPPTPIEVFNWWTEKGESSALQALLDLFRSKYPQEVVHGTPVKGSDETRNALRERMIDGHPPNTFQANGGLGLFDWVLYNNVNDADTKLQPLDDLYTSEGWATPFPPEVLKTVLVKNIPYAVPLNIHRDNTLYYNKRLFEAAGVRLLPTTIDELFAVADTLKSKGITPFALGAGESYTWTLQLLLFENLLVARAGGAYYRDFFLGRGSPLGPEMTKAVDDLARLLSYTNTDALSLGWSDAVDLVGQGNAAMVIMGDWARGRLIATLPNLDDIGEMAMPGTAGTFVFTTDTFCLPKGAGNMEGTLELLRLFGSKEGQNAFNPLKGSIPARNDATADPADAALYDAHFQQTILDFRGATNRVPATSILVPQEFIDAVDKALYYFAGAGNTTEVGNKSIVLHTIANWYDVLPASAWQ